MKTKVFELADGKVGETKFVQYMTKESLIRATNRAIRMKLNRIADLEFLKTLHPTLNFPVTMAFEHKGYKGKPDVVRHIVFTNREPFDHLQIDIPHKFLKKDVFRKWMVKFAEEEE